jgi:peptidyl-prolyl cis-trans isomerase D
VGLAGQVPDVGQLGQVAPQLFDLNVGAVSGPINAERNGIVARITDKQEPTAAEIEKNLDQTRDEMLEQKRQDAFSVFLSGVMDQYKKKGLIRMNAKAAAPETPGM